MKLEDRCQKPEVRGQLVDDRKQITELRFRGLDNRQRAEENEDRKSEPMS